MAKIDFSQHEVWFITGSQHLYGPAALEAVARDAKGIVAGLNKSKKLPVKVVWKPTVTRPEEITRVMSEASFSEHCVGVVCWMHTFSPAKMWINGLKALRKPMLHLHTQANRDIPWSTIDMDFMNLNQSAHGDREFGFLCTRMYIPRKVVVGYYTDPTVLEEIAVWMRVCAAQADAQTMKIARIGDNMREVAVTDGNKVSAQIRFGYAVNGYGIADLVRYIDQVSDKAADALVKEYLDLYDVPDTSAHAMKSIREAARQEIGMRAFLEDGDFAGLTTTFEDLTGVHQLMGLACQRLMADGYGFGAEGDWKTAALLRTMKVMAHGLRGGTSFMEDYTYHLEPGRERALAAHMLEVCPSLAAKKPSLEVHPLGIGGKADPARLVFDTPAGAGIAATMIELEDGYRLIVNEVDAVKPDAKLPKLPVARAVWVPRPDFHTAVREWIENGGAHHSVFSQALTVEHLADYADITGTELVVIGD